MKSLYYDKKGRPISLQEFAKLSKIKKYREIGRHQFSDGAFVSTVWLGIDHSFTGEGQPIIFETMSFDIDKKTGKIDWGGQYTTRYTKEEDAKKGHAEMVAKVAAERFKQGKED